MTFIRRRVATLGVVAALVVAALAIPNRSAPSAPQQQPKPKGAKVEQPDAPPIGERIPPLPGAEDAAVAPRQAGNAVVKPAEIGDAQPDAAEEEQYRKARADIEALLKKIEPIKPIALAAVPDDPPPHEGAMISQQYIIEPPDLVQVDVLEALPGRPIMGERVVRSDGTISLDFYGDVEVRGLTRRQAKERIVLHLRNYLDDTVLGLISSFGDGAVRVTAPTDTDRIFFDLTAYNSKVYFVMGDVAAPGRLPFTGNETVLDAINYAGGLAPTHDPDNIVLARPARGGKPARTYKIDYKAILDRADNSANLQIFPGDRLVVGRHPTVETTVAIDRMTAPFNAFIQSMLTYSTTMRSIGNAPGDSHTLTPAQREAIMRKWVDFWLKLLARPKPDQMDEKTFREALVRELVPPAEAQGR